MRVIIVDDHPLVQEALHQVLRALVPGAEVLKAKTLAGLQHLLLQGSVPTDLLLLDVSLEGVNTLDYLDTDPPELMQPCKVPVVLFTGGDNATLLRARALGCAAVVHKGAPGAVLQTAIVEALGLTPAARQALTPRQHALMQLVCLGATNQQIAEKLSVTENTVKAHLSQVFDRLRVRNRGQAVVQYAAAQPQGTAGTKARLAGQQHA